MLTHCFLTNMENEEHDMFLQSTSDNHKKLIQRTYQMRNEVDLQAFFSSVPICQLSYMVFQYDYP